MISSAYGIVLELGPGSGEQSKRLDTGKIIKVYGVEPNISLHAALGTNLVEAGLGEIYTIIPNGFVDAEALKEVGLERESVDTVLCIKVLCSVPEPEKIVGELYQLLKPGGQLIFFEHVRSPNRVSRLLQGMLYMSSIMI